MPRTSYALKTFGSSATAPNPRRIRSLRGPGRRELRPGVLERLRHDLDVGEDRHEVRVPCPARDDVQVDVVDDPGARDPPEVPPEVESLRPHHAPQHLEACRSETLDLERLLVAERAEVSLVTHGRDHDVA